MATRRRVHRPPYRAKEIARQQSAATRKKRGLTTSQMLRATDPKVLDKATGVSISGLRIGQERKSGIMQARGNARDAGVTHQWKVRLKGPLFKALWCTCSCEYWLFHCEYALTEYGASSIINSNGEPPVVTNPRMIPKVCKHIAAVLESRIADRLVAAHKRAKARG